MAKVILGMTISLDGFIKDSGGSVEALYPDLADWRKTEPRKESIQNTCAVAMGRNSCAMAEDPDWFAGNYEYQLPIFVLTHHVPRKKPKETDTLTFTFVQECVQEKNGSLFCYDIIVDLKNLYEATPSGEINEKALELIEVEMDAKYKKKDAGV